eukprot:2197152-Rhodomonas_salina.3
MGWKRGGSGIANGVAVGSAVRGTEIAYGDSGGQSILSRQRAVLSKLSEIAMNNSEIACGGTSTGMAVRSSEIAYGGTSTGIRRRAVLRSQNADLRSSVSIGAAVGR